MSAPIVIGEFILHPDQPSLTRGGTEVSVGARALSVLRALALSEGMLTKDELLSAAWPDTTVEESNLAVQVSALRKVLGNAAIQTIPRVGYRLRPAGPGGTATFPRLAVLPFDILGGSDEDAYFADGLADDIITALGRFRQFGVITRQTAVAHKNRLAGLGVAYALEGTVRRSGDKLRIAAHLSETATGRLLWAHQMDGDQSDLFAFQDAITAAVATAVAPEIEAAEIAGARENRAASLSAYDLYLRALPEIFAETEEGNTRARDLLDRALAEEPDNPLYLVHAAWVLEHRSAMGWPLFDADHRPRCVRFARKALMLAKGDSRVLTHAALALVHMREYELAAAAAERALHENPNNALALIGAAVIQLHVGDLEQVRVLIGRLEALDTNEPLRHIRWSLLASYHLLTARPGRAVDLAALGMIAQPNFDPLYWVSIAACVQLGRMTEAERHVDSLRAISPTATVTSIRNGQPRKFPERIDPILAALHAAGLPEV